MTYGNVRAVIFDLDNTLLSTDAVENIRTGAHHEKLLQSLDSIYIFERTEPVLNELKKRNIQIGLVTNSPRKYTQTLLQHFNLADYFDCIVCWDDVGSDYIKPSPAGIKLAMDILGLDSSDNVIYVGDQDTDFIAAYGARVIPVAPSWANRTPFTVAPSAVINSNRLVEDLTDLNKIKYLAETASEALDFSPQKGTELYFLPLNENSEIVPISREDIATIALGRYFSLRSELTAQLHSEHKLSRDIYRKEENPNFQPPVYWTKLFSFVVEKLAVWLFEEGEQFDIVTVIPSKPEKTQRLERMLSDVAESSNPNIQFLNDLFYFNRGAKSLKTLGHKTARTYEVEQNLHLNQRYAGILENKKILILDDVITTGATLSRAYTLLNPYRPAKIIGSCLAKTVRTTQEFRECPECGRAMRVKRNSTTKVPFRSCSGFDEPNRPCNHTENIPYKDCPNCGRDLYQMSYNDKVFIGHHFKTQGRTCTYNER